MRYHEWERRKIPLRETAESEWESCKVVFELFELYLYLYAVCLEVDFIDTGIPDLL